jgi:peroxiredoxin (alkyl hydroperoxide reductase subunit C)
VLAFFPGAFTPVCTTQIPGYQSIIERFEEHEVQLLGVSVDTIPSLKAWAKSMGGLSFPLMSDFYPHGEIARLYGVFNPRGFAERAIILIDKAGIIRHIEIVDPAELPDTEALFDAIESVPEGPTRPDEYLYK